MQANGRIVTKVNVENLYDVWRRERRVVGSNAVRSVTVEDAVVDSNAALRSLPGQMIRELGLDAFGKRGNATTYGPVRLTIHGRTCTMDILEAPSDGPAIVGRIPLASLDLVLDLAQGKVTGNPAHGGEQMYESY
jgi:hypothetical protein